MFPFIAILFFVGIMVFVNNTPSDLPAFNIQFRYADAKVQQLLDGGPRPTQIRYYNIQGIEVRSIEIIHNKDLPNVYFIHGAPGSSGDYYKYLISEQLTNHANLIAVDRPGYGYSGFGKSVTALARQASIICRIIKATGSKDTINLLVGHSYGGPIAAKIAMDFPNLVKGIIMLAPAIDPENEKSFKIAYFGHTPPFRWITPTALQVAADEKITHVAELQKIRRDWRNLQIPICHIHGTKDRLVPFENLLFAKRMIRDEYLETIVLEGTDHFIPWTNYDLVEEKILEYLDHDH